MAPKDGRIAKAHGYRRNVGIAVFNADGQVLVAERVGLPGSWQMPQGGIDEGEEPWAVALRELKEEIGTDSVYYLDKADRWLRYDFPPGLHNPYLHNYLGQEQQWFAVRFTGNESEIDIDSAEPREFQSWRWTSLQEAADQVVEFKRPSYQEMARQFARFATKPVREK